MTLVVTNAEGSDTEIKDDYIDVTDEPVNTVHVADMSVGRTNAGVNVYGRAWVTVEDDVGATRQGATVYGYFNAPDATIKSGVTDSEGVAQITANRTKSPPGDFCFTVTNIVLSGYTYDEGANAVTTACESGWQSAALGTDAFAIVGGAEPVQPGLRFSRPNPFQRRTEIAFALAAESHARIEIFNVAGRSVAVLADRVFSAGSHKMTWDASGHPSGVYFCRLTAGTLTEAKRMMLLR